MTPDQPAAPVGLYPGTAVICAGRPGHAGGGPLNASPADLGADLTRPRGLRA